MNTMTQTVLVKHGRINAASLKAAGGHRATNGARIIDLPLADLQVDPEYQREFDKAHASRILATFNQRCIQTIKVSIRNNIMYVIDGLHTKGILLEKGFTHATCEVFEGLSKQEEVGIFHANATSRKRIQGWPAFKSLLTAEDKEAKAIVRAMHKHGFVTPLESADSHFKKNTASLIRTYRRKTLDKALQVVKEAWGGDIERIATSHEFFLALGLLLAHSDVRAVKFHKVIACLSKRQPGCILSEAAKSCKNAAGRPTSRDIFNELHKQLFPLS